MLPVKDTSAVLIPDGVAITQRLAPFPVRLWSALVDLVFILVVFFGIERMMAIPMGLLGIDPALLQAVLLLLSTAGVFGYFILLEGLCGGRTVGKMIFKLRTVGIDGTPLTFSQAVYRNLLRPADFFPVAFLSGLVCMFITEKSQRIGDLVAGSMVVRQPDFRFSYSPAPHRYGLHPLEDRIGTLRGMTLDDYVLIKRLCDRFPNLTTDTQQRLLDQIWFPFAKRINVESDPNIHPMYQMEAVIMKFGRMKELV